MKTEIFGWLGGLALAIFAMALVWLFVDQMIGPWVASLFAEMAVAH